MTIENLFSENLDLKNQVDTLRSELLSKEERLKRYERYSEQLEEAVKLLRGWRETSTRCQLISESES